MPTAARTLNSLTAMMQSWPEPQPKSKKMSLLLASAKRSNDLIDLLLRHVLGPSPDMLRLMNYA